MFPLLIVLVCFSAAAVARPSCEPFERFDDRVLQPDEWSNVTIIDIGLFR